MKMSFLLQKMYLSFVAIANKELFE